MIIRYECDKCGALYCVPTCRVHGSAVPMHPVRVHMDTDTRGKRGRAQP